jgi:dCMP deaminase
VNNQERFMRLAHKNAEMADCHGHRVGAVLVSPYGSVICGAHNATPRGMTPCTEGGCTRCDNRENLGPGLYYDMCICVHAEQNVLLACARNGVNVSGTTLFTTLMPCLGCCKELINAGVVKVYYDEVWELRMPVFQADHNKMLEHLQAQKL